MLEPPPQYRDRKPLFHEPPDVISIGRDHLGREAQLEPEAARAWQSMRETAAAEGIVLTVISAFRSVARQEEIVSGKLRQGLTWEQILKVSAYPGFSEHHTGRAIDLGTPGCPVLTESFENTDAFRWLARNAARFGFALSYPRGNPHGVVYEPWHWMWHGEPRNQPHGTPSEPMCR
jgi:D-alanyl-D-alanine carboxypeptidase